MGMESFIIATRTFTSNDLGYRMLYTGSGFVSQAVNNPDITVSGEVAYWRRAYVIHSWFERRPNYDIGEDVCPVTRGELRGLLTMCLQARNTYEKGHFLDDIMDQFSVSPANVEDFCQFEVENTIPQLQTVLAMPDKYDFHYKAAI